MGESAEIPEALGRFTLNAYKASYSFMDRDLGATLIGELVQKDGSKVEIILPLRFPSFDRMGPMFNSQRKEGVFISVVDIHSSASNLEKRYFTGLQVTMDPGVWVVYTGFTLMIIGCIITFFMSHQRICITVTSAGNKRRVMVAGRANKNKIGMQRKVEKLALKMGRTQTS